MSSQSSSSSPNPLKIFIFAMDGVGHINACVGLAQALVKRGHRIQFLLNEGFKGQYAKFGFEEVPLKKAPPKDGSSQPGGGPPKNPIKEMADNLLKTGMLTDKTPLQKFKESTAGPQLMMQAFYATLVEFNPQIGEVIKREKPDLFILDHFFVPPALAISGIPWMYLFSGNPLMLYQSDKLPPFGGGYSVNSDPETWKEFRQLHKEKFLDNFVAFQKKLNAHFGYKSPDEDVPKRVLIQSPYLNIYGYPEELDYHDIVTIPPKYARVDAFIRETPEPFQLPFALKPNQKLIFVSMGSLGSIDVNLMKRITSVLATSPHQYIVSKGQRGDEYELPENCWGANFLPQTKILPLVDLVITHGGNNTITETICSGKPMIVLPLFADQYDNAQRVDEKGFGVRLSTDGCKDAELLDTIERLLNDREMLARAQAAAKRIESSNSKELLAVKIEQIVKQKVEKYFDQFGTEFT